MYPTALEFISSIGVIKVFTEEKDERFDAFLFNERLLYGNF